MEFEQVQAWLRKIVYDKEERLLSDTELLILKGSWEDWSYKKIASKSTYSLNYLMRDLSPRLFALISEILGRKVGKKNLREVLEIELQDFSQEDFLQLQIESGMFEESEDTIATDWGSSVSPSIVYGREVEKNNIKHLLINEKSRILTVLGMYGIGKTTLVRQLAAEIQEQFDILVWRSVKQFASLQELLVELIASLSQQRVGALSKLDTDQLLARLLELCKESRCLVILDDFESLIEGQDFYHSYQDQYQDYEQLIATMGQVPHQSAMVICSQRLSKDLKVLNSTNSAVCSYQLQGLKEAAVRKIFHGANLHGEEAWPEVIEKYQGNPLALRLVVPIVQNFFNGDLGEFIQALRQQTQSLLITDMFWQNQKQQFFNLSEIEKEILSYLSETQTNVSLHDMRQKLTVSLSQLIPALESLKSSQIIVESNLEEEEKQRGKVFFKIPDLVRRGFEKFGLTFSDRPDGGDNGPLKKVLST